MGTWQKHRKITHKRAYRSALTQAGDHKAAMNRQDQDKHETKIAKKDPQKKLRLVRKLLEGLNMFDGTNLTLISDVDQDT